MKKLFLSLTVTFFCFTFLITQINAQEFLFKYGTYGSGEGQFYLPMDVDIDDSNNIYITDLVNRRIQKLKIVYNNTSCPLGNTEVATNGSNKICFIKEWGSLGSGDGQFENGGPRGLTVDSIGNVYVADAGNARIQKFSNSGEFITEWGSFGSADGQFSNPTNIASDSSGNLYVADFYNSRIQKFDSNGNFITKWGSYGSENGQFRQPIDIAIDSTNNVYVADSENNLIRIQKFDSNGNFITKWGSYGSENGQFNEPLGINVDDVGNIYISEFSNRIQKFDSNGNFITKWGSFGTADGQFHMPRGMANDSFGNIHIVDFANNRLQVFSSGFLPPLPQMINPTDNGTLKEGFDPSINHYGIDIDKTLNQRPVKSPAGGTIVKIDPIDDSNAGKWIWVSHGSITKKDGSVAEKISTRYLHMDTIATSIYVGKQVEQGEILGTVGTTGVSTAPHLHFEVRQGDISSDLNYRLTTALDPLLFVNYTKSAFSVSVYSPVDIIVTDPDGLILSKTQNDFGSDADYFELTESDGDNTIEYEIASVDQLKSGDYLINIVPESGAQSDDVYTIKTTVCGTTVSLSENTPVKYIPDTSYIVRTNDCAIERIIPIKIITSNIESQYILNSNLEIGFQAIDNIFGTASISATLNNETVSNNQIATLSKPGSNVLMITATDNNGNVTTSTKMFNVYYNTVGFLLPITSDGSKVYNQGRTLPVKFELRDVSGNAVSSAIARLYVAEVNNGAVGDDIIPVSSSTANTGNYFRYDTGSQMYIFNLSTNTMSAGIWQLKAVLDSGQEIKANVQIKSK